MATKSVILRPTTSERMQDSPNVQCYPSDTTTENAYLLVSEAVADDDATYITAASPLVYCSISFDLPEQRGISGVKGYCRVKSEGTIAAAQVGLTVWSKKNSSLEEFTIYSQNVGPGTSTWTDYEVDFNKGDNSANALAAINNCEYDHIDMLAYGGTNNSPSSPKGVSTSSSFTQMYVELIYENSSSIYFYENGSWVNVPGTIYQKQNGTWAETDDSVFSNGDYFISPKS